MTTITQAMFPVVMAGLDPGHPRLTCGEFVRKTWMPGIKPGHDGFARRARFSIRSTSLPHRAARRHHLVFASAQPAHADLKTLQSHELCGRGRDRHRRQGRHRDARMVSHRSGGVPRRRAGHADRRPYPAQRPRARRLRLLADPAKRRRHALRRARQFRDRGRAPVPQPARRRRRLPRSPRPRPTTAIWWPISPRTANMTTTRRGSPAFSGCW